MPTALEANPGEEGPPAPRGGGSAGLRPGAVLGGRYRLVSRLGEGTMGVVWAAVQTRTEREVAIKVLKGRDSADTARFLREARVVARLSHRNVVQIYDFWDDEADDHVFMVMERLVGETLEHRLERVRRLAVADALALAVPVASALSAAHGEGIVHRDLKPANVFLARRGDGEPDDVRVLDFGLARPVTADGLSTEITQKGSLVGTPCYMAPEQVYAERDIDVRADIWALGVILYECLTGERPFAGDNLGQVIRRVSAAMYRPLRELAPDVPAGLESLVRRMLAHDRERRPNAAEVCDGLAHPHDAGRRVAPESTRRLPFELEPAAVPARVLGVDGARPIEPSAPPPRQTTERLARPDERVVRSPATTASADLGAPGAAPADRGGAEPARIQGRSPASAALLIASGALGALVCVALGAGLALRFGPALAPGVASAQTPPSPSAAEAPLPEAHPLSQPRSPVSPAGWVELTPPSAEPVVAAAPLGSPAHAATPQPAVSAGAPLAGASAGPVRTKPASVATGSTASPAGGGRRPPPADPLAGERF